MGARGTGAGVSINDKLRKETGSSRDLAFSQSHGPLGEFRELTEGKRQ